MPKVRQRFVVPMKQTTMVADGQEYTLREPELFGAECNWGQVADYGPVMTIIADIEPTERDKIPARFRREILA